MSETIRTPYGRVITVGPPAIGASSNVVAVLKARDTSAQSHEVSAGLDRYNLRQLIDALRARLADRAAPDAIHLNRVGDRPDNASLDFREDYTNRHVGYLSLNGTSGRTLTLEEATQLRDVLDRRIVLFRERNPEPDDMEAVTPAEPDYEGLLQALRDEGVLPDVARVRALATRHGVTLPAGKLRDRVEVTIKAAFHRADTPAVRDVETWLRDTWNDDPPCELTDDSLEILDVEVVGGLERK